MVRVIRSDIYVNDEGELDVDYMDQSHGGITTRPGKSRSKSNSLFDAEPYVASDTLLNGHIVYSVYPFSGDSHVDIFKKIKRGEMNKSLYYEWLNFTARYIQQAILSKNKPDLIVVPESSSNLIVDLAAEISRNTGLDYLPHAFKKNPVEDITINLKEGDPAYKSAAIVLQRIKDAGRFEAKNVPKQMLKFFKDIYTVDDDYIDILEGQRVAVLDDSMTSKATMSNIFDVCDYLYETEDAYGITIFKHTTRRK